MLSQGIEQIQQVIVDVRHIVEDLRPPALDQLGLVGALKEQASRFSTIGPSSEPGSPLPVSVEVVGDLGALPAAVEVAAFRIVCEALHNARRHSRANWCLVRLAANGVLQLEVIDDGRGMPARYRAGIGLESMRHRATQLGGSLAIEQRPEGGTRVCAQLPLWT